MGPSGPSNHCAKAHTLRDVSSRHYPVLSGAAAAAVAIVLLAILVPLSSAPARAAPRIVAAAGDISPASRRNDDDEVAAMIRSTIRPDALLVLGDAQYESGTREEFQTYYANGWGVRALA